eukprot:9477554-Pyramimonas_sp.AAC.1
MTKLPPWIKSNKVNGYFWAIKNTGVVGGDARRNRPEKVRRIVRRSLKGKGKGRSKGKGERRRLHGRGTLAFLASLTGLQREEMLLGTGRNRRHASGKGKGRRGNPKDANGKSMECDACHSAPHFRRECPQGDGSGRGPSMHLAQTDSDIQDVDWGSLLADPADGSATIAHFVAA